MNARYRGVEIVVDMRVAKKIERFAREIAIDAGDSFIVLTEHMLKDHRYN